MHIIPFVTTQNAEGATRTWQLTPGCIVSLAPAGGVAPVSETRIGVIPGNHYTCSVRCFGGQRHVTIRPRQLPICAAMDRDDCWHRRQELADLLSAALAGEPGIERSIVRRALALSVLVASYLEAFPPGATVDDVRNTAFSNTQARLEAITHAYLRGDLLYDVQRYASEGVRGAGYSHLAHFGWIYAQQIRLCQWLLTEHPREVLTIVDLGTGCGHFLVTLARHFAATGQSCRVRLVGIDRCGTDAAMARDALRSVPGMNAVVIDDDLAKPTFADQLRRLKPDLIVANHVLEHLPGDVMNRYLQDWLLAARLAVSISVPLGDELSSSISEHVAEYTAASVQALASSADLRTAGAARPVDIETTSNAGLCSWVKPREVVHWGGFSCTTVTVVPRAIRAEHDAILADFGRPFTPDAFAHVRRAPKIGEIGDRATFAAIGSPRQVRQLPIKFPGTDVQLPGELAKFREAVQIVIDHNRETNPQYAQSYAYLNVFQGTTLFSSYRGLSLNCHGDQLQRLHGEHAYLPDWSYIASSALPTQLYEQPFDVSDVVSRARAGEAVNLYDALNAQASDRYLYRTDNFGVYLLSPYVVHAAAVACDDIERVFFKIAISAKRFFDNRELRRNRVFPIDDWYLEDTVGYIDGWLNHAHWNERFVRRDIAS